MKANLFKLLIAILFIAFNVLNVYSYSYLKNKYNNKIDYSYNAIDSIELDMLNEININKEYQKESSKSYKLVKINNSKYDMVDMNYNYNDLFDLFNNDNKDKLNRLIDYSNDSKSQVYLDEDVYSYIDILGINIEKELNYIEVYDMEKVFNSKLYLKNYDSISKLLGEGTKFINHGKTFDYYIYAYKHKNLYIEFISFYESGENSICVIRKNA